MTYYNRDDGPLPTDMLSLMVIHVHDAHADQHVSWQERVRSRFLNDRIQYGDMPARQHYNGVYLDSINKGVTTGHTCRRNVNSCVATRLTAKGIELGLPRMKGQSNA